MSDESQEVALWMIARDYATGHGDTISDMLNELEGQISEKVKAENAELRAVLARLHVRLHDRENQIEVLAGIIDRHTCESL